MEKKKRVVSAGRVQSVSVRLVCRARKRHSNFNASASYSVVAEFTNEAGKSFKAKLPKISIQKKKLKILNKNIGSTYRFGFRN
jgi:DNA topoisomerase-1